MANTFTLNNGNTYEITEKGYYYAVIDGKKTRCSAASYEMARVQFTKEEEGREKDRQTEENFNGKKTPELSPAVINEHGLVECSGCPIKGTCIHYAAMRRNPESEGGLGLCPRLKIKVEEPKVRKASKPRKSKDIAYEGYGVTLTAKQVDFMRHLPDTYFWEHGLDSEIWCDCLADDIRGQFAGKPMTTGAMLSTICEKGLGFRRKGHVNGKKCTSFGLTDTGKKVAAELGLR